MGTQLGKLLHQAQPTRLPETGLVYQEDTLIQDYVYNSAAADLEINVPASPSEPVYLLDVLHLVRTAFTGGTPSIDVGDGTTADKWIATAAITEGTAGNLARNAVGAKFTAPFKIKATLSASLAAGAGSLVARVFRVKPT